MSSSRKKVLHDWLTTNTLTGVMICERGRRSVTLGRDAVGWLSFSVDATTTSRSTSAQTHIRNTQTGDYQQVTFHMCTEAKRERARSDSYLGTIILISLVDAPVSQTHQCHVTCQGQNLVSKPRPQTWGFHSWAGKPYNKIKLCKPSGKCGISQ